MAQKKVDGTEAVENEKHDVTLLSMEGVGMSAETFKELKEKYGLDVRIRTDKTGLDEIMRNASEMDGYDRTHPGYGRSYDKN